MLVIVGLCVWLVAGIVAIAGELSNARAAHPLIENLRVRLSPHASVLTRGELYQWRDPAGQWRSGRDRAVITDPSAPRTR